MNHFKLVALAESPTRYTKVIRNPGADTKYNRRYESTDYVSRYTKSVAPPASYAPPSPDFEPLAVAPNQGSNWIGSNVYEVGRTIEAKTASYTGGLEPVTYRCRFQWKPKGTTSWVNGEWMDTENKKTSFFFECKEEEDLKFQTQARDSQDPAGQLNSVTGVKTCVTGADFDALSISKGAQWDSSNVYEIGQMIEARTAVFAGGHEPVTYKYRFQSKRWTDGMWSDTDWVTGPWMETTNEVKSVFWVGVREEQIRFQSWAEDSSDPVNTVPSYTPNKSVVEIGDITATVFGNPYDLVAAPALTILTMDPIPVAVQMSGMARVTYNWSVRGNAGVEFSDPTGASTDVTIATAGVVTIQCAIQSEGNLKQADIQFFGVATREELNELTN